MKNNNKWHTFKKEEVLQLFKTDEQGLSKEEVKDRLEEFGLNKLPEKGKENVILCFLKNFHNVLIYILIIAALATAFMGHWLDTWVILGVVIINGIIGFLQEEKAEKALESIKHMLAPQTIVIREGNKKEIDAEELVPGDIVLLSSGDKVPADLRIIEANSLQVEEAALTGESTAVTKGIEPVAEDSVLGDRTCLAYSGTKVTGGTATGVVVATASETELGKINIMISEAEEITTPLIRKINEFGKILATFIIVMAAVFFVFGYFFQGFQLGEIFLTVIGLAVASIPEGLPAIMTITLALGVQRMAGRNAIIRKLPAVETLGSVTVICSDKTGTLTKNEMTVENVYTASAEYNVEGSGYAPEGLIKKGDKEIELRQESVLKKLLYSHLLCNDTELRKNEDGNWEIQGSPTEGAIKSLALKGKLQNLDARRLDLIPFDSKHKNKAVLVELEGARYIFVNGAPDGLFDLCQKQLTDNGPEKLNSDFWEECIDRGAKKGQRVLGSAYCQVSSEKDSITRDDLQKDLVFLGIAGMMDPPRPEAIAAIEECKEAGIKVKMITGDHALTAMTIGKQMGIGDGEKVITGKELEEMDEKQFRKAVREYDIFARTSPEHKLRLVRALQDNNEITAMSGDGVNDAPALKQADIGIAMGIKGTEVTKESASMVLLDDNFASIVNAVEEGRTIFDNIRKTLFFMLPTNGAESLVLIVGIILGIAMAITPVQILWVNMVTAVTLALALSFEPMEKNTMKLPPRDSEEPILEKYFIGRISFVSIIIGGLTFLSFVIMKENVQNMELVRTVTVNTLVFCQMFYLFNCRKIHEQVLGQGFTENRLAFAVSGILIIFQLLFTYLPVMNTLFATAPMKLQHWIYPVIAGILVFSLVEFEKIFYIRWEKRN